MVSGGVEKASSRAPVVIRDLLPGEVLTAVGVVARGMQDNPVHVAAYGGDADHRCRVHGRLVSTLFAVSPSMQVIGAERDGVLVGVAASAPPATCQPGFSARARLLVAAAALGPFLAARVIAWNVRWARHDLAEPHVHLGPVAVDAGLRGQGLGGALLREHTSWLDTAGVVGYLETDRAEAVGFYERFGYRVVGSVRILGVPTWLMRRPAAPLTRSRSGGR
jgi:GNAT superfamily N-acetyltransferase